MAKATTKKNAPTTRARRTKVPAKPPAQTAYVAPSVRAFSTEWTPALIRSAEIAADSGYLRAAASLCETLLGDDRIRGCLVEARIKGLLGLPLTFEPGTGRGKRAPVRALEADEDWWDSVPSSTQVEIKTWGILLGVCVVHQTWEMVERATGGSRLLPTLEVIHPQNIRWDDQNQQWFVTDRMGREIPVTPNDGEWLFYTPYGLQRPWARGLWRSLSRYVLSKLYAISDWGRYGELHGQGLFVGTADKDAICTEEDRKSLASDLATLGRDKAIALPPGYKVELVEATAKTYETYVAQIEQADKATAIATLGQNLTTDVQSGSRAAATVHDMVKNTILSADGEYDSTFWHDGTLIYWAAWNYGNAQLAPWPEYDTSMPEDVAALVTSWSTAGTAITAWINLGVPVDLEEAASMVRMPLKKGQPITPPIPAQPAPEVSPSTPAQTPEQAVPTQEPVQASRVELAQGSADNGQPYVNELVVNANQAVGAIMRPELEDLNKLIGSIEDGPDWATKLKAKLVDAYSASPEFATILERTFILAELAGYAAILEEV